jgi:hypothetical protein
VLGSLVGHSESNVRAALKLADAFTPCVVFCDEPVIALAGSSSSGQTDSGVFFADLPGRDQKDAIDAIYAPHCALGRETGPAG